MKKIIVEELHIFSLQEKKAKKIKLADGVNIVLGQNRTGKSSLTRNIFWGLGASVVHPKQWKDLNTATYIKFKVDDKRYSISRYDKIFKVFNENNEKIGTFGSITNELAPFLSKIFDFKLTLTDSEFSSKQAPPSFLFLPFYIDQEESWKKPLTSFSNLKQFQKWKPDLLSFHTGIKPNEFYEKKSEIIIKENEVLSLNEELKIIKKIKTRQIEKHKALDFSLDPNLYIKEIESLMSEIQPLRDAEHEIRNKLKVLYEIKNTLKLQLDSAKDVLSETVKDFEFASEKTSTIECPICGTVHDNTFEGQLEIAEDEDRIEVLIAQIQTELNDTNYKIDSLKGKEVQTLASKERINSILSTKKEKLTLHQLISNEGVKTSLESIKEEEKDYLLQKGEAEEKITALKDKNKIFNDRKRAADINKFFHEKMVSNLHSLQVLNLTPDTYKNINCVISTDGSDLPRAVLAYYFSLWATTFHYNSEQLSLCPIAIDSPNQGGQDDIRLPLIYDFIFKNIPTQGQFILTAESVTDHDISQFNVINLDSQYNLLNSEDFSENAEFYCDLLVNDD